ncbi:MAG: histidine phosphatase family protein [Actinomycetota bacterium]
MLIVCRHGRTPANAAGQLLGRLDPGLDDVGRAQAAAIASVVPAGARVISSPLRRCQETAAAIGATVETDERLIEIAYGDLEGVPVRDVEPDVWRAWRDDITWAPPGGESHAELAARVWSLLDELVHEAAERDVVLVSHVSPIKAATAWALGVGIEMSWRAFVAQAAIVRIATGGATPSLHAFNEVHHLADLDLGS